MAYLRTVRGDGQLIVDGIVQGPVRYTLDIQEDLRGKWAEGLIEGELRFHDLLEACRPVTIHRPNGTSFRLIIVQWRPGICHAAVKSDGPFPEC